MPKIDLKPKAKKFIESLPPKHKRQVKDYILSLQDNPLPYDAKKTTRLRKLPESGYRRVDIGEYRIIYRYENKKKYIDSGPGW